MNVTPNFKEMCLAWIDEELVMIIIMFALDVILKDLPKKKELSVDAFGK
jgi:hypothetical protein